LAVSDKVVGRPGAFVGLENFRVNLNDTIFLRAFQNTFVFLDIALGTIILAFAVWLAWSPDPR
jgi:ABC-type sugar transport system permease subunit